MMLITDNYTDSNDAIVEKKENVLIEAEKIIQKRLIERFEEIKREMLADTSFLNVRYPILVVEYLIEREKKKLKNLS